MFTLVPGLTVDPKFVLDGWRRGDNSGQDGIAQGRELWKLTRFKRTGALEESGLAKKVLRESVE
jgi:hypothetical protein